MKMQILYFTILSCYIQILYSQSVNQPGMSTKINILPLPNEICQQGYFFNSQICQPCQQIIGGYCLCSSYNQCDTIICNDGMIEYKNQCIQHPDPNCLYGGVAADGSTIICYQCKSSLFIIGGICVQVIQCGTVNIAHGTCMECLPGYFLTESILQNSIDETKYYLQTKQCEACNERCLYCTSKNVCQSCRKGYYLDYTLQICEDCTKAIPNCSSCLSKTVCSACVDPYYISFIFTCVSCQKTNPNCLHCGLYAHNQIVCSLCENGYFLDQNSNCISCSNYVSNCEICSSNSICDGCVSGYYLNNNTCQMCTINLEGCLECLDNQQCTKCSIGYYLNQNICIKCSISISNCLKCENNQICNECKIGYYLDNYNTCKKCSDNINNCSECENNQKCNKCQIGYYLNNNQCSPCIDNQCQDCQNDSSCTTCNLQYQWDGSKCEKCITQSNCQSNCSNISYNTSQGCKQCSTYMENCNACSFSGNSLKCQTCTGSSITTTNSEPCSVSQGITCQNNQFVYGTNCIACDSAIPKCISCQFNNQNELECTKCNDGYSLGGQCEPCIQNTQNQDSNSCNNCPLDKYYNSNKQSCDSCSNIQNCLTCSDQSTCINCIDGYFYINNTCTLCSTIILNCVTCNNNQTCTECITGYYLDQNTCNICSNKLKNCISCIDNQTCNICDTGYYLMNNKCLPCSDQNCINCQQNSLICTTCASGFYSEDQICKPCSVIDGCISCKNNIQCTACQSGFNLNQNTKQCSKCNDQFCINCNSNTNICQICQAGYYLNSNNECQQCSIGCTSCTNSSLCQSCQAGYHLDGTQCLKCSNNLNQCITCISNSIYTSCLQGYFLSNSQCQQCPSSLQYCINCLNDQVCSVCQNGYYLDGITCKICTNKNCLSCINTNICTQCQNDYILNSGACQYCKGYTQYCTSCSKSACSKCISGYVLLSNGTCAQCPQYCYTKCYENPVSNTQYQTICSVCYDGYYFNQDKQCQNCQQNGNNALRCSYNFNTKKVMIIQCQDGYFLVNNLCIKAQNVNTCAKIISTSDGTIPDSNNCLECWPNYFQNGQKCFICNNCENNQCLQNDNGNFICKQCLSQYYADDYGICQPCAKNCLNCTSSNIADCSECLPGYFNNSDICKACTIDMQGQTTCLLCSDSENCQTCKDGFFNNNGKCYSCQVGCRQCNYPGNACLSCQNGYYFQNGGCVLFQANCLTFTNGSQIIRAQNQDTGCEACNYGFYLVQALLTQSNISQVVNICLQCINAESSFVCRSIPKPNSLRTITTQNTMTNPQYFIAATKIQSVGMERKINPSCQTGYFWSTQSCMPCMEVQNGICECKNFDSCDQIICSETFYLVSLNSQQYCVPIPQGCSKIIAFTINQIACSACNSGYLLVGTICILSKGCEIMNQNTGVCMKCQNGYYFNNNFYSSLQLTTKPNNDLDYYNYFNSFCSPCQINQCDICSSEFTCLTCKIGYFWMQSTINQTYPNPQTQNNFIPYQSNQNNQASGQCVACLKYCAKCTDQNSCDGCFINFQLKIDINNIYSCYCPDDYILNQDGTCTPQTTPTATCNLIGCTQCSSDGTQCLACNTNNQYALTGTTCTKCPSNCNSCTAMNGQQNSSTTCSECSDGYFKVQASTDQPVMCQSCSSQATGALRCQGQLENQSQFTIVQCQDGYYLYNNNTCVKTLTTPTCFLISSQSNLTCQSCLPGYILYGSTCASCSDSIKNCSACEVNSSQNGLNCLSCSDGYVPNPNQQECDQCPTGCQICSVSINNSQFVYQCQTCLEGNFINAQGQCQGCPYYCKSCSSQYYCNICEDGYYLAPETKFQTKNILEFRACQPCQDNCQTCTWPGNTCLTCPSQYIHYNGGCIQNQNILYDQQVTQIQYTLPCLMLNSNSTGCEYCLCGFFMDKQGICRECVSPYSKFVCGVQPSPIDPSPPNNPYTDSPQIVRVGENPQQPNSWTYILIFYILNLIF